MEKHKLGTLEIVYCADELYIAQLHTAIFNVLQYSANNYFINFWIIGYNDLTISEKFARETVKFNFIEFDNLKCEVKFQTHGHVSNATYYRLYLEKILPKTLNKILYLDLDILVLSDLWELFSTDIKDYPVAAVADYKLINQARNLGLESEIYFNAGVLLINLKEWRKNNYSDKCLFLLSKWTHRIEYWDQDILNYVFNKKWMNLSKEWNVLTSYFERNNELLSVRKRIEPKIIHFTGGIKPWHFRCRHPFKKKYLNNLIAAGFYDSVPKNDNIISFLRQKTGYLIDFFMGGIPVANK